jgi:hypothetical protein
MSGWVRHSVCDFLLRVDALFENFFWRVIVIKYFFAQPHDVSRGKRCQQPKEQQGARYGC